MCFFAINYISQKIDCLIALRSSTRTSEQVVGIKCNTLDSKIDFKTLRLSESFNNKDFTLNAAINP